MNSNFYETDRALAEYLWVHYGMTDEVLPRGFGLEGMIHFPVRSVSECCDAGRLPANARALDLGCAVGRATFELARHCGEVIGIDYSERFVTVAEHLRKNGSFLFGCINEGDLAHPRQAVVPREIDRSRVKFQRGDAMELSEDLGAFDVVLMANLIDRLSDPRRCLGQLPRLVKPGGRLILTSPYTWMTDYTPKEKWLGGFMDGTRRVRSFETLTQILSRDFQFASNKDLPLLIREHERKFQLCVAEASVWIRK